MVEMIIRPETEGKQEAQENTVLNVFMIFAL
jgi:hypothetical protein